MKKNVRIVITSELSTARTDLVEGLAKVASAKSKTPKTAVSALDDEDFYGTQAPGAEMEGTSNYFGSKVNVTIQSSRPSYSRMGNVLASLQDVRGADVVIFAMADDPNSEHDIYGALYLHSLIRRSENKDVKFVIVRTPSQNPTPSTSPATEYLAMAGKYRVIKFQKLANGYKDLLQELLVSAENDKPVWQVEKFPETKKKEEKKPKAESKVIKLPSSADSTVTPTETKAAAAAAPKKKVFGNTLTKFFEFLSVTGSKVEDNKPAEIAPLA